MDFDTAGKPPQNILFLSFQQLLFCCKIYSFSGKNKRRNISFYSLFILNSGSFHRRNVSRKNVWLSFEQPKKKQKINKIKINHKRHKNAPQLSCNFFASNAKDEDGNKPLLVSLNKGPSKTPCKNVTLKKRSFTAHKMLEDEVCLLEEAEHPHLPVCFPDKVTFTAFPLPLRHRGVKCRFYCHFSLSISIFIWRHWHQLMSVPSYLLWKLEQ